MAGSPEEDPGGDRDKGGASDRGRGAAGDRGSAGDQTLARDEGGTGDRPPGGRIAGERIHHGEARRETPQADRGERRARYDRPHPGGGRPHSYLAAGEETEEAREGFLPGSVGETKKVEVSPDVVPYLNLYPLPNGKDFGDGTEEFVNESTLTTREDHFSGKLDLILSPTLQTAARYTFDDADSAGPDPLQIWTFAQESRYQFLHSQVQWIHSANTIATLVAGFSSVRNDETSVTREDIPAELSFVPGQPLGSKCNKNNKKQ